MSKSLHFAALVILTTACGGSPHNGSHVKGAPHEFDAICGIDVDSMSFRIYEGKGLLQSASFPGKGFQCNRGDYQDVSSNLAWTCDELGGGNAHIEIVRESASVKKAKVWLDGAGSGAAQILNCF